MDWGALFPAGGLGALTTGGTLLAVVVYLLAANRADRKEYQDAIDKAEARADQAEKRRREAEADAEAERDKRRKAEDTADALSRELSVFRPPPAGGVS